MKRVFIVGAIGFGKMSDECLLQQIIHTIRRDDPSVHISVLSHKPGQTAKLGLEAVPRDDIKAMWEAVEDSDTVIWLQSEHPTHWRALGLEIFLVRLAKRRKRKIHACRPRVSKQPPGWMAGQARRAFERCDKKHVFGLAADDHPQDPDQSDVNRPDTSHPLYSVRRLQQDGLRHLQDEGIYLSQRPIALCIDRQTASERLDEIAALADTLIDRGATLMFMPVDHFADMEAANHVLDKMSHAASVMRKTYTAQEWIDILGDMQTVVTTYDSVQAMCGGLDVPSIRLNEQTLASIEKIVKIIYRQK